MLGLYEAQWFRNGQHSSDQPRHEHLVPHASRPAQHLERFNDRLYTFHHVGYSHSLIRAHHIVTTRRRSATPRRLCFRRFSLFVSSITQKLLNQFSQNFSRKATHRTHRPRNKPLNFGGDVDHVTLRYTGPAGQYRPMSVLPALCVTERILQHQQAWRQWRAQDCLFGAEN